jgi:hypothetical protein
VRRAALLGLLAAAVLTASACRPREAPPQPPTPSEGGRPTSLARATSPKWPTLSVEILGLDRPSPDVLEIRLAIVNAPGAPAFEPREAFAADPSETGSLSAVYLLAPDRQTKYFVLRDGRGQPLCTANLAGVGPGGRVEGFVRFVAPGSEVASVTVHVPGFEPAGPLILGGGHDR